MLCKFYGTYVSDWDMLTLGPQVLTSKLCTCFISGISRCNILQIVRLIVHYGSGTCCDGSSWGLVILDSVLLFKSGRLKPVEAILWGSLGPDPLTFWQWGFQCARTPAFTVVLYAVPVNINADFTILSACLNSRIKCLAAVEQRLRRPLGESTIWKGKRGLRIEGEEGERWPGTPKFMTDCRHWLKHPMVTWSPGILNLNWL